MPLTFGSTAAPSNITTYLDSLFAQSLANYRDTLIDNIAASNALLHKILKSDSYEEADGGTYIAEPLMYGLAPADSYDGYDELGTMPTDGITQAIFQWRQVAAQVVYNMKEVIQNQHRLVDLVKSKIMQSEMGLQEYFAQALFWGAGTGAIITPKTSLVNGSQSIDPLPLIINFNNTAANQVGNLDPSTATFWQNRSFTSQATIFDAFLFELDHAYNTCALGTGGPPDLMVCDQVTYELYTHAYFNRYRQLPGEALDFPFENQRFKKAVVVMDDKIPDVYTTGGVVPNLIGGSGDPASLTYGTMYFINTKFFRLRYHPSRDFELLKDENGKTFAKPINGDSRIGHIGWMGNITINNRRKHGVLGKIARTLTAS